MVYRVVQVLMVFAVTVNAVPFEDCGSLYDLKNVTIDNCNRVPCDLHPGSIINVTTYFIASFPSDFLENHAMIIVSNIENDAMVTTHSCAGATTGCVNSSAELKSYSAEMLVNEELPPTVGRLSWRVTNEYQQTVLCFKVYIQIVFDKLNGNSTLGILSIRNQTDIL